MNEVNEQTTPSTATDVGRGHPGVLVVVCSALFFAVVNGSAVTVMLPEIGADLGIGAGNLPWVLTGFMLMYGVAIPFYGRLASRYGARRLFLIGVVVFSAGSLLSAFANNLAMLLLSRAVQAAGGAAVPGLGMTLASRAFPEHRRGTVLGVLGATMGVAAAAGPLAAGVISEVANWRMLFAISALSILIVPLGIRYLDREEVRTDEAVGVAGGLMFSTAVAGALFFVTRGSRTSWIDAVAMTAAAVTVAALLSFALHQRRGISPFIPRTLLSNRGYVALIALAFAITFANFAAQLGFPLLFFFLHDMSTLEMGVALAPAAITMAVFGVVAGRVADKIGTAAPIRVGAGVMALGALSISTWVGSSVWSIVILASVFAIGFALVNTPLATAVSLIVPPADLASALSLNTMMYFIGASFGATVLSSIIENTDSEASAVIWLHDGPGAGFSNAFLALLIPISVALVLSAVLRRKIPATIESQPAQLWKFDCQVPWCAELESANAVTTRP